MWTSCLVSKCFDHNILNILWLGPLHSGLHPPFQIYLFPFFLSLHSPSSSTSQPTHSHFPSTSTLFPTPYLLCSPPLLPTPYLLYSPLHTSSTPHSTPPLLPIPHLPCSPLHTSSTPHSTPPHLLYSPLHASSTPHSTLPLLPTPHLLCSPLHTSSAPHSTHPLLPTPHLLCSPPLLPQNPQTAIPKGTLLAIAISTVVYLLMAWLVSFVVIRNAPGEDLLGSLINDSIQCMNQTVVPISTMGPGEGVCGVEPFNFLANFPACNTTCGPTVDCIYGNGSNSDFARICSPGFLGLVNRTACEYGLLNNFQVCSSY